MCLNDRRLRSRIGRPPVMAMLMCYCGVGLRQMIEKADEAKTQVVALIYRACGSHGQNEVWSITVQLNDDERLIQSGL